MAEEWISKMWFIRRKNQTKMESLVSRTKWRPSTQVHKKQQQKALTLQKFIALLRNQQKKPANLQNESVHAVSGLPRSLTQLPWSKQETPLGKRPAAKPSPFHIYSTNAPESVSDSELVTSVALSFPACRLKTRRWTHLSALFDFRMRSLIFDTHNGLLGRFQKQRNFDIC